MPRGHMKNIHNCWGIIWFESPTWYAVSPLSDQITKWEGNGRTNTFLALLPNASQQLNAPRSYQGSAPVHAAWGDWARGSGPHPSLHCIHRNNSELWRVILMNNWIFTINIRDLLNADILQSICFSLQNLFVLTVPRLNLIFIRLIHAVELKLGWNIFFFPCFHSEIMKNSIRYALVKQTSEAGSRERTSPNFTFLST